MANNNSGTRAGQKAAAADRRAARQEKAAHQAAALKAQKEAQARKQKLVTGGIVAAVLVALVAIVWWTTRDTGPAEAPQGASGFGVVMGEADAPNEITVFEDFSCGHCAAFEAAAGEQLAAAAATGSVKVRFHPVNFMSQPGNDYSLRAANAVAVVQDAAGAEVAKTFHDMLFAEQPNAGAGAGDNNWLIEKAVAAGAEESDVEDGIRDIVFKDWINEATDAATDAGVNATPTIFLNGEVWENSADIEGLIEAAK